MTERSTTELVEQRAIWPDDFHDHIPRISEVAPLELAIPVDLQEKVHDATEGLLLPRGLADECAAALLSGNVVLQGPPGTGKSSLARALARAFHVNVLPVTAQESWSTFEVIGRQELRLGPDGAETVVPVDGFFTEAVIQCAGSIAKHADDPESPQATWLLIDELNRAHADKAFGELFSVLGTNEPIDITLGYQRPGNSSLVVPRRFRIVATVNSIDRQFVNALSQGLRRRFTFLELGIPPQRSEGEPWTSGESQASKEFALTVDAAVARASSKTGRDETDLREYLERGSVQTVLEQTFELAESVRYATGSTEFPFVPIATAPLIDTVELFLVRSSLDQLDPTQAGVHLDWAVAAKLAPLFDTGGINRDKLAHLAESLSSPFSSRTRAALLEIYSDGLFYVAPSSPS